MPLSDLKPAADRIAFVASTAPEAQAALRRLRHRYGSAPLDQADAIVALGGDGFMLSTLHRFMHEHKQIYGMNRGSVGFLMNDFDEEGLVERIWAAEKTIIRPLRMEVIDTSGAPHSALAINEVSLLRQRHQAARLRISVDGKVRIGQMVCDGALVATPAGSTAYNLSANGPILPLNAPLLALTPLNPFRPRRWRGALLPDRATVRFEVEDPQKRPVSATADHTEIRHVARVDVALEPNIALVMLHDPGHSLDERILREQFGTDATEEHGA